MSPALSRAFDPLRFRPFLWMALAALCGVASGGQWVLWLHPTSRADARLFSPLFAAAICAVGAWFYQNRGFLRRVAVALLLFFVFLSSAARRISPPAGDVSELARLEKAPPGPVRATGIDVSGTVADYPRVGDFNIQFPFECDAPRAGRIWVSAPYGTSLQIGDRLELLTELHPLPTPGNVGERATAWRYIGAGCWCLGIRVVVAQKLGVANGYATARRIGKWREGLLHYYESQFRGGGTDAALRQRPFPAASAQLLTAMVFGEGGLARPLPGVLSDDFRAAGLSHVLVASGSQVVLITTLLLAMTRGLGLNRRWLLITAVPLLVFYALLAGGAVSIWRATLGGVLLSCSLIWGRDVDGLSLWGAALLALLVLDPASAWSLSFQLTFAATWGLLVIAPVLSRLLVAHLGNRFIFEPIAFSLGAQSATLPISLVHFGTFSVAGMGANLFVVPMAGLMIVTGLIGLVPTPFNVLNYYLTRGAASVAHIFAQAPGAQFEGNPIRLGSVWLYYALLLLAIAPFSFDFGPLRDEWKDRLLRFQRKVPSSWPQLLATLLVILGLWFWWLQNGPTNPNLRVTMLDVGQGESVLIRTPSGQNVLIDGGSLEARPRSDIGAQVLVPALQSLGVERLDLLILTHADADHCNGLATLAREIPIDAFLDGPGAVQKQPDPSQVDYWELRKALAAQKVPFVTPRANQIFALGETRLQILAPEMPPLQSENNNAIVARLDFGKSSFLFTGDIEKEAEARLLQRGANLKCTVLKVAHHGSLTSTTPAFLKAANPSVALISCGRYNRFGHPGADTLRRLNDEGTAIFRTDINGSLEVDCNRATCQVTPMR